MIAHSFSSLSPVMAFWSPGPGEMLLLVVVALLLYGGNLPEVARTWGKTLAEFRRSLSGIQNEFNEAMYSEPERLEYRDDRYTFDYNDPIDAEAEVTQTEEASEDASTTVADNAISNASDDVADSATPASKPGHAD